MHTHTPIHTRGRKEGLGAMFGACVSVTWSGGPDWSHNNKRGGPRATTSQALMMGTHTLSAHINKGRLAGAVSLSLSLTTRHKTGCHSVRKQT